MIAKDEYKSLNMAASMYIEQLFSILYDKNNGKRFNVILDNFDVIDKLDGLNDIISSSMYRIIKTYIITYLSKLCCRLSIKNNLVLNESGEDETFEKEFVTVDINDGAIQYPKTSKEDLKIFDLKGFVVKNNKGQMDNSILNNNPFLNKDNSSINIDDLIKNIDKKIEELEKEEKKLEDKKNSKKSDLEQFKI